MTMTRDQQMRASKARGDALVEFMAEYDAGNGGRVMRTNRTTVGRDLDRQENIGLLRTAGYTTAELEPLAATTIEKMVGLYFVEDDTPDPPAIAMNRRHVPGRDEMVAQIRQQTGFDASVGTDEEIEDLHDEVTVPEPPAIVMAKIEGGR